MKEFIFGSYLIFSIYNAITFAIILPHDEENSVDGLGSHHFNAKSPAAAIHGKFANLYYQFVIR